MWSEDVGGRGSNEVGSCTLSSIELAKKRHPTYVPDELVRGARCKNPFAVSLMNTDSIISIKSLTAHIVMMLKTRLTG